MDWSNYSIPAMQLEARFGDRVVPAFSVRPKSISTIIADAVSKNPDGEALVCGAERLSWREVEQRSAGLAAGLRGMGLGRGDRVALLLGNRVEFVLAVFAAAHLGAISGLLRTRQQNPEIAYVLGDYGATLLIHEATLTDVLRDPTDVPALLHRLAVGDQP